MRKTITPKLQIALIFLQKHVLPKHFSLNGQKLMHVLIFFFFSVESQGSVERVDLEGQEGVGGVWHIDYLSLPPPEKINDKWKITRYYGETLQDRVKTIIFIKKKYIILELNFNPIKRMRNPYLSHLTSNCRF